MAPLFSTHIIHQLGGHIEIQKRMEQFYSLTVVEVTAWMESKGVEQRLYREVGKAIMNGIANAYWEGCLDVREALDQASDCILKNTENLTIN